MAGFLEDPVSAGAMSLGLRLLATPGKFGQALGTAGLGAMNDMDRARVLQQAEKNRALQDEMLRMQIEQVKRQQAERDAQRAQQGTDQTLLRTMMENGSQGPAMPPDPRLFMSRGGSLEGVQNLLGLNAALAPKPKKLTAYKPGDQVRDEAGNVAFEVPAAPKEMPDALWALAMIYGEGSPKFMRAAQDYARKLTTHAPAAMAVSYGSPVPFTLPDGNTGYIQPGNREGAPPQVMIAPGGKPAVKPPGAENAPTEGERKSATLLQRLRGSQAQLRTALESSPESAKPGAGAEATRKVFGDTPANIITPAARQQVEAAQLDILDAALTLGTGAAYTREQLESYRRAYFPQIGDDDKAVADKAVRLENVIQAAEIAAGRAGKNVPEFPTGNAPKKITSEAEYKALPKGASYIAPDGTTRRKQ
jgi:hypothetical protein